MRHYAFAVLASLALGLAACSGAGGGSDQQKLAEDTTRAVYNNDMEAVAAKFSTALAPQVTRGSLGVLSDEMHKMGNLQGLTETDTDTPARRYTFDAKFDNGDMTVQMRLDGDGKIVAYRVTPGAPH
jgi:hypothetical protein